MARKKIVLGLTGSIACYMACDLVNRLKECDFEVRCVMTQEAQAFVRPLTFEVLSREKVYTDLFGPDQTLGPLHTALALWADLVLVYPCSANLIGKLAHGIYDDLLTCLISATKAKIVICPAMSDVMYQQPIVQANIRFLKKQEIHFVGPVKGHLTCNIEGLGHVATTEEALAFVKRLFR